MCIRDRQCFCISIDVAGLCCDADCPPVSLTTTLNFDGSPPTHPDTGALIAEFVAPSVTSIEGACTVRTCELPANLGAEGLQGISSYTINLTNADTGEQLMSGVSFQLDSETDYTTIMDAQGCIKLTELLGITNTQVSADFFCERVWACVQQDFDSLTQIVSTHTSILADHEIRLLALELSLIHI